MNTDPADHSGTELQPARGRLTRALLAGAGTFILAFIAAVLGMASILSIVAPRILLDERPESLLPVLFLMLVIPALVALWAAVEVAHRVRNRTPSA